MQLTGMIRRVSGASGEMSEMLLRVAISEAEAERRYAIVAGLL